MFMECINVFNKSIRGASHLANGKPCQDYSISFSENGVQILVVCDGHGGETYFRSDIGAKLAAEVTLDILKGFSNSMGANPFSECSFSITAKPRKNPFVDSEGNRLRYEDMNESQKGYAKQAQAYTEASSKCVKEQKLMNELLRQIYNQWKNEISIHCDSHPFSSSELSKLNGKNIEKAYGCTLLAYLQTESYWLSFQIGDGKILFCNKNLSWSSPIQEDCNCFLNYTTSLCDNYAIDEFRYAFCGNGFYGLKVHESVLAMGNKVTGATVHFVDEKADHGPILLQKAVEVQEGDTPEILQRRVMEQAEWKILPKAIDLIGAGKVTVKDGIAHISE